MPGKSLFGKILKSYILIVVVTLVFLGVALGVLFPRYETHKRAAELEQYSRLVANIVAEANALHSQEGLSADLTRALTTLGEASGTQIVVVDRTGTTRISSNIGTATDKPGEEPLSRRPEEYIVVDDGTRVTHAVAEHIPVQYEIRVGMGDDFRALERSDVVWLDHDRWVKVTTSPPNAAAHTAYYDLAVGVPIMSDSGEFDGAVIVHTDLKGFWASLQEARPLAVAAVLAALAVSVGVAIVLSSSLAKPVLAMTRAVTTMQTGDFRPRVSVASKDELGVLAEGVNHLAARLGDQERSRREFLANVSHDLRTPLTTISGSLQAITEDLVVDPDEVRRSARLMLRETARLTRLVTTLLDLERMETGALELQRETVDLAVLLEDLSVSFVARAEDKVISFTMEVSRDLPRLWVDVNRCEQIIANLLDNALRFTPRGGRITMRAHPSSTARGTTKPVNAHGVRIVVENSGPGIPAAELPYVWDRFYTGDRSRSRQSEGGDGLGLGLRIVRDLTWAHGGTVDVSSDERLTRFMLWLPVSQGASPFHHGGSAST